MVRMKHVWLLLVHLALYGLICVLVPPGGISVLGIVFAGLLIWISLRDIMVFEVPDIAVVLLLVIGVLQAVDPWLAIGAALLYGGLFLVVAMAARHVLGRDALGLGDVKLMAGIGAWLGPFAPIYITLFASVSGVVTLVVYALIKREKMSELGGTGIAFGPFLCLFAWVMWEIGVRI